MNTACKYHHKSRAASNCQLSRQSHGVIPGHQRGIPLLDARAAPAGNSPARRRDRQVETRHQRGIPLLDAETRRTNTNAMCTTTGHHNQYVVSHLVSSLIPQSVFSSQAARKEKVSVIEMRSSLASVHICQFQTKNSNHLVLPLHLSFAAPDPRARKTSSWSAAGGARSLANSKSESLCGGL